MRALKRAYSTIEMDAFASQSKIKRLSPLLTMLTARFDANTYISFYYIYLLWIENLGFGWQNMIASPIGSKPLSHPTTSARWTTKRTV